MVGLSSTLLTLVVAVPCAYGLSRLGRKTARSVNVLVAVAAAFPYVLLFLALLQVARDLHLGNNLLALSLPYTGLSLPLAILLLRARFATSRRSWKKLLAWKAWGSGSDCAGCCCR